MPVRACRQSIRRPRIRRVGPRSTSMGSDKFGRKGAGTACASLMPVARSPLSDGVILFQPLMDPGRGYRSFGYVRVDGSGADVQSFGDFHSRELLGLDFILERYRCSGASPYRPFPGSWHLESHVPGIVDAISHGDALVRHRPAQRSISTCSAHMRRVGPRSSLQDKAKEISPGNETVTFCLSRRFPARCCQTASREPEPLR